MLNVNESRLEDQVLKRIGAKGRIMIADDVGGVDLSANVPNNTREYFDALGVDLRIKFNVLLTSCSQ
jgi:hypothetical protein